METLMTAPAGFATLRPRLRGRLHQVAAIASIAGLVWLLVDAPTATAAVAACVYGVATILLYATSSSYHLYARSPRARALMQRLDHSMIYVLIAGTYTPVCLLAITGPFRWVMLALVWTVAVTGVLLAALALDRFPKLMWGLYLGLGWAGLVVVPTLAARPALLALGVAGGILYTVGAVLFAMQRPRPIAKWFGYHEWWHAFGVAAGGVLFAMNLALIAGG
jgi:hemolysin III